MIFLALILRLPNAYSLSFLTPSGISGTNVGLAQEKIDSSLLLKNYFHSKGYVTGIIEIPELNVSVRLKKNQFYRKEEKVKNVYNRINQIRIQFGLSDPYPDSANGNGWCGVLSAECCDRKASAYIILVKAGLNDSSRIYTTGHEHGHFLWYIDRQESIFNKFENPELIRSRIRTNSDFAVMCGWAALKMAGYVLNDCIIIYSEDEELEKDVERIKNLVKKHLRVPM